jgi:hypothetical protein
VCMQFGPVLYIPDVSPFTAALHSWLLNLYCELWLQLLPKAMLPVEESKNVAAKCNFYWLLKNKCICIADGQQQCARTRCYFSQWKTSSTGKQHKKLTLSPLGLDPVTSAIKTNAPLWPNGQVSPRRYQYSFTRTYINTIKKNLT